MNQHTETLAELQPERAILEGIIRGIPDALILANLDRVITYCNPAVERIFGYAPGELIGQSTSVLYADPEDFRRQGEIRFHSSAKENHEPMRTMWKRKCGSKFHGEAVGTIIHDANGYAVSFLGLIRDVTTQTRLQAEQRRWYRVKMPFPKVHRWMNC